MKRTLTFLCLTAFLAVSFNCIAQQDSIQSLYQRISKLEKQNQVLREQYSTLSTVTANIQSANTKQDELILQNENNVKAIADSLGVKITSANDAVASNTTELQHKTVLGIVLLVLLLVVIVLVYIILHMHIRRGNDEITALKDKADQINAQVVTKLNGELSELQKITSSVTTPSSNVSDKDMTELVKAIADKISFMEVTLYRMDKSVKGYKQLSKSIEQMKNNLLANGYEIVEMLGKPYHEGMKVVANFVEDDTMEEGKQIITGITKPQINHNGVMIQSAQITVSQN